MSSSESDDEEFNDVSTFTDKVKFYQVQFVSGDNYKFSCVGYLKKDEKFSVELTKFNHEDFYCAISSNFFNFVDSTGNNITLKDGDNLYLFDMITMDVLCKNGKNFKIILSVEIKDPNFDNENKGNLMIWVNYEDKHIPLKTGLTHPGNDRLPYYIIGELKNEKINEIIGTTRTTGTPGEK